MISFAGIAALFVGWNLRRVVILGGGALLVVFLAYNVGHVKGKFAERAKCQEAALRAEIAQLKQDLEIQKRITERVQNELADLNKLNSDLQGKVTDYEKELRERGESAACLYDDNDVRRLRDIGGGTPKGKKHSPRLPNADRPKSTPARK